MGKTAKKFEIGNTLKGQTSLNSFFSKQPPGGKSKLFTQVLPGSRTLTSLPQKTTAPPHCIKTTDSDDVDFQPEKKLRTPLARGTSGNIKPVKISDKCKVKATRREPDISHDKRALSGAEGKHEDKKVSSLDSRCQLHEEVQKTAEKDPSDTLLQVVNGSIQIACSNEDSSDVCLAQNSKVEAVLQKTAAACNKPVVQASSFQFNSKEDVVQESQGSPITVIPETPEVVINSGKTKESYAKLLSNDLTPTRKILTAFPTFVPETPMEAGHQSRHTLNSPSRLRWDSASKRGKAMGRGNRLGKDRTKHQQHENFFSRGDKFASFKSRGRSMESSVGRDRTESSDLLKEMLEEFSESLKTVDSGKDIVSQRKILHQSGRGAQGVQSNSGCSPSKSGVEGIVSVLGSEQNTSVTSSATKTRFVPAKSPEPEQYILGESSVNGPKHLLEPSPSKSSVGCDLEDMTKEEIDPLEEMLQEYAASSSSSLSLTNSKERKMTSQSQLKITSLGDRQLFHATRPSSKLSRTFRKKHQIPRSGASPAKTLTLVNPKFGGSAFVKGKHLTEQNEEISDQNEEPQDSPSSSDEVSHAMCENPGWISTSLEDDLLASGTKRKVSNPFALKPSKIKLNTQAMHKPQSNRSKMLTVKSRLNTRKRSPCKGSSPYAKRPSTSHLMLDAYNLDIDTATLDQSLVCHSDRSPQNLDEEKFHIGFAAKKSLFQEEKENFSLDAKIVREGSLSSPDSSPRNLADRTNLCDPAGNVSLRKQDKCSPDQKMSRNSDDEGITKSPEITNIYAGLKENAALKECCLPAVAQECDSVSLQEGLAASPGTDALWEGELSDSLLAAMDMEDLGTNMNSQEKLNKMETQVVHDFRLLSPFKTASDKKEEVSLPADLRRYRVTGVQDLGSEKVLQLHCLTEHKHRVCSLKGTWSNTLVEEGDTVAVHGQFDSTGMCTVDQQQNFLVVHPDLLVTGTNVSRSIRCMRRSVLSEKFKGMDRASKPMLLGTILHEVFDRAVEGQNFSEDNLLKIVDKVSHRLPYLTDMYAVGMTEHNVLDEAQEYIGTMKQWADRFLQPHPKQSATVDVKMPAQSQSEKCNVCVSEVKEIEETVWSPRWGIKGKMDLTVGVKIHQRKPHGTKREMTIPLELKTGKQTNSIEHRSQLVLYSLMLGDLQNGPQCDLGLLLYLKTGAMLAVPATRMDKRELVHLRNQLAYYIALPAKLGNAGKWALPRLPAPIEDDFTCGHCPHLVSCGLLQRMDVERGNSYDLSEAGYNFFAEQINHLSSVHIEYFSHWYLLCALESIATEKKNHTKHIWSTEAWERELSSGGQCLSGLFVAGCRHNKTQESYHITFKRSPSHPGKSLLDFQVSKGDRVAVSVEGTRKVATCTGFIESISAEEVTIKSERPLRSDNGCSHVYRMDKDDGYNSMASSLVNLAKLMHSYENGYRLRNLIVDLCEPQFDCKPRVPDSAESRVAEILGSLNPDQQRAIDAVLRCQDYTLIIGMPGTGKTTTIVALVRILCACGLSVLLTSYTHSAVDNILLKLTKFGISPLRLGEIHRVHPELIAYTEKEVLGKAGSVQQLASLFETKLVVATTCLGAKHTLLTKRTFDICIVDEASQISQLVCLGPLFHARRFVLVGDHKQLPPLVQSNSARQLGMDESLFQRLGLRHESTPLAAVQLSLQYRMNSDIMTLSNSLVYEGRLQCGNDKIATATLELPEWDSFKMEILAGLRDSSWVLQALQPETTVCFLNTDKIKCTEVADEKRTVNSMEAMLVKHLVQCLMKCGCAARNIGIISPYRNQCKLLGTMLDQHIEVNTVDKYQGRDKEVIIVSFATKDQQSETGFLLQDIRRLNVALTRAKHKLILIGCIRALRTNEPMERLIECLQTANFISLPMIRRHDVRGFYFDTVIQL